MAPSAARRPKEEGSRPSGATPKILERLDELKRRAEEGPWGEPTPFLRALNDAEPLIRCMGAWALGHQQEGRGLRALELALQDPDPRVRQIAADALGAIGHVGSRAPLIAALDDPDGAVRLRVAWSLGTLVDPDVAKALAQHVHDPDPEVRRAVATGLGRKPGPESEGGLAELLTDTDAHVRREAVLGLRATARPELAVRIRAAMHDPSGRVRVAAAIALGHRRDREAVPLLLERLRDDTTFVQPSILIALGRIGDPAALPLLLERARVGPSWTRVCALRALADLGRSDAVLCARDALEDVAWSVRGAGADVLGRIGDASDLTRLLRLLDDPHPWPRRGALYALGRLDLVEAVPRMREELRHGSPEVRLAAIWSLGRLRDDGARELLVGLLKALPVTRRPGARKPTTTAPPDELGTDAEDRTFDALIQALGRIAEPTQDPAVLRVLLEARARVREDEWDRPARLPPPEQRVETALPTLRMLFDAALPVLADEEGEI